MKKLTVEIDDRLYAHLIVGGRDVFAAIHQALEDFATREGFDPTMDNQVLLDTEAQNQRRAAASVRRWETGGKAA